MGAQATKSIPDLGHSKDGHLYIQLERKSYTAGETVTGTVCLNLLNFVNQASLVLKFSGHERVFVAESHMQKAKREGKFTNEAETEVILNLHKERRSIIKVNQAIHSWQVANPGQYAIPFSFLLPHYLPGSFYAKGSAVLANISYKIVAEIRTSDANFEKLKYKENVEIKTLINKPFGSSVKEDMIGLRICCCKNKGSVGLVANLEKDILGANETTNVTVDVDNTRSSFNVKYVDCQLIQVITVSAQGYKYSRETEVARADADMVLKESMGQKYLQIRVPKYQTGDIDEFKGKTDDVIAHELYRNSFPYDTTFLTTKSKLIEAKHYIKVRCVMDKWCCNSPSLTFPIEVTNEQITEHFMSAPPMWNPQVLETVNMVSNDQYRPTNEDMLYAPPMQDMDAYNQMMHQKKEQ